MAPSRSRQPDPFPAVGPVADRLHSAAIHILRGLRPADRASGLSGPRLSALSVIVFGGPIRMTDLARAEQVRAPTMTLIVRGLERAGLVRRSQDRTDRRAALVHATARGRRVLLAARTRRVAQLAEAIRDRPAAERRRLAEAVLLLERLVSTLRVKAQGRS